jgi:hypothetical protein
LTVGGPLATLICKMELEMYWISVSTIAFMDLQLYGAPYCALDQLLCLLVLCTVEFMHSVVVAIKADDEL